MSGGQSFFKRKNPIFRMEYILRQFVCKLLISASLIAVSFEVVDPRLFVICWIDSWWKNYQLNIALRAIWQTSCTSYLAFNIVEFVSESASAKCIATVERKALEGINLIPAVIQSYVLDSFEVVYCARFQGDRIAAVLSDILRCIWKNLKISFEGEHGWFDAWVDLAGFYWCLDIGCSDCVFGVDKRCVSWEDIDHLYW